MYDSSEPIHICQSLSIVSTNYPESAYQWLVEVLDGLIDFGNRHGHYGVINLTENEYEWLDDVLEELIYSVDDNENHFLAPLMEFIIRLIGDYEDAYVPKLTERNTKLAEEGAIKTGTEDELAAHAFFSIGYLLWQGNKKEKSLSAYDKAITLEPDFAESYANRGMAKIELKRIDEAKSDLQTALKLSKSQGQEDIKAIIEKQLQELNNLTTQDREN
jgi:tetratricopeptide (TPR) repeat protein